jgi:hypothetical protein
MVCNNCLFRCPINVRLWAYLQEELRRVIIMSVLPPFNYPSLPPHSHRVIIVFCDLQIFSCLMNKDASAGDGDLWHADDIRCDPSLSWDLRRGGDPWRNPSSRRGSSTLTSPASALTRPGLHRVSDLFLQEREDVCRWCQQNLGLLGLTYEPPWPPATSPTQCIHMRLWIPSPPSTHVCVRRGANRSLASPARPFYIAFPIHAVTNLWCRLWWVCGADFAHHKLWCGVGKVWLTIKRSLCMNWQVVWCQKKRGNCTKH